MRNITSTYVMCLNNHQILTYPDYHTVLLRQLFGNPQFPLLGSPPYGTVLFVMSLLLGRHPPESSATMLTNVAFSRTPLKGRLSDALGLTGQAMRLSHILPDPHLFHPLKWTLCKFYHYPRRMFVNLQRLDNGTLSRQLRSMRYVTCCAYV